MELNSHPHKISVLFLKGVRVMCNDVFEFCPHCGRGSSIKDEGFEPAKLTRKEFAFLHSLVPILEKDTSTFFECFESELKMIESLEKLGLIVRDMESSSWIGVRMSPLGKMNHDYQLKE